MQAKVSMKIGLYKKFKIASWSMSTNFPGSAKQLRKTPKTKKEQSCKIVVSNKTK